MKKVLIILICLICLCGCKNKATVDKTKKHLVPKTYAFCYVYSPNVHISKRIYYDNNHNVVQELALMSTTYESLSEAIEQEKLQQEKFKNTKADTECSITRTDKTVAVGCYDYSPDYEYEEEIIKLENDGYKCSEEKEKSTNE